MLPRPRALSAKKAAARQEQLRRLDFRRELLSARESLALAQNHLDQVTDPEMIDCCIYQINAAQLHYQVLLKQARANSDIISRELID
ncbi:DUF2508 family protein [Cuneatibacter caecimuris]|uniref:Uncharacterized protein DUF2508 n=1 Tax=Cuneatibacter caecimuris TaxID=1796618 RepID=A0A4Q7PIK6_9FIRM|nr:DUF2508 family protein [Cuneatibacter caecimuris]RZT00417.1 uncharacterized protein DUF2508 [Cuneatibacter caecimuris]